MPEPWLNSTAFERCRIATTLIQRTDSSATSEMSDATAAHEANGRPRPLTRTGWSVAFQWKGLRPEDQDQMRWSVHGAASASLGLSTSAMAGPSGVVTWRR